MNKKTKLILVLVLTILILIIGSTFIINKKQNIETETLIKNIQVFVYDENEILIYDKGKQTEKNVLVDLLKSLDDLNVETETGPYGEYIISINSKKQGDNYYWNYYINGEYASVGISSHKIKDNDIYSFKLEKFE